MGREDGMGMGMHVLIDVGGLYSRLWLDMDLVWFTVVGCCTCLNASCQSKEQLRMDFKLFLKGFHAYDEFIPIARL